MIEEDEGVPEIKYLAGTAAGASIPLPIHEGHDQIPVGLPDEVKEELKAENDKNDEDYNLKLGQALAKQAVMLDDEKNQNYSDRKRNNKPH